MIQVRIRLLAALALALLVAAGAVRLVAVGRSAVANPEDVPQLIAGARKNGRARY